MRLWRRWEVETSDHSIKILQNLERHNTMTNMNFHADVLRREKLEPAPYVPPRLFSLMREALSLLQKKMQTRQSLPFLQRCRLSGILPRCIIIRSVQHTIFVKVIQLLWPCITVLNICSFTVSKSINDAIDQFGHCTCHWAARSRKYEHGIINYFKPRENNDRFDSSKSTQ